MKRANLIKARKNLGKTQHQVAKELGISDVYLRKLEAGVSNPGRTSMLRIESYYRVSMRELFSDIFLPNNDMKYIK